jgi:hypothetical protein
MKLALNAAITMVAACSTPQTTAPVTPTTATSPKAFPLEVGGDYLQYTKLTPEPFLSAVHGNRLVNVYVTPSAAQAYLSGGEMPVNAVVVKDSFENVNGQPGPAGPIFVMQKRAPGYAPEHGDWYYGLYWAQPNGKVLAAQGKEPGVGYCISCHDSYDRQLGGLVPTSQLMR